MYCGRGDFGLHTNYMRREIMGSWNDILKEVNETQSQYDYVRRKYLKELSNYTGRNTIAYYSSWLNKQGNNLDINVVVKPFYNTNG